MFLSRTQSARRWRPNEGIYLFIFHFFFLFLFFFFFLCFPVSFVSYVHCGRSRSYVFFSEGLHFYVKKKLSLLYQPRRFILSILPRTILVDPESMIRRRNILVDSYWQFIHEPIHQYAWPTQHPRRSIKYDSSTQHPRRSIKVSGRRNILVDSSMCLVHASSSSIQQI